MDLLRLIKSTKPWEAPHQIAPSIQVFVLMKQFSHSSKLEINELALVQINLTSDKPFNGPERVHDILDLS